MSIVDGVCAEVLGRIVLLVSPVKRSASNPFSWPVRVWFCKATLKGPWNGCMEINIQMKHRGGLRGGGGGGMFASSNPEGFDWGFAWGFDMRTDLQLCAHR